MSDRDQLIDNQNLKIYNSNSSSEDVSNEDDYVFKTNNENSSIIVGKASQDQLDTILHKIGMGKFQYLLFILCGFGWMSDNMWLQGIIAVLPRIQRHYSISDVYAGSPSSSLFFGMAASALFWGGHSDLHGRRDSFNWSLIIATVSGAISAFAPNFFLLNLLFICVGFGVGSAVPVDSSILLEFLPSKYHYFVTGLSLFFNAGSVVASLFAYLILPSFSCVDQVSDIGAELCNVNLSNNGWRYLIIALSILEGIMVISRVILFKLPESPQYLLAQNRLDEVVDSLNYISKYNGLTTSFTIHDLEPNNDQLDVEEDHFELREQDLNAEESSASTSDKFTIIESHFKTPWILRVLGFDLNLIYNLFQPYYRLSTILIWSLWIFQAAAFVLFTVFLPKYLELKGQTEGESSMKDVYWGYLIYAFFGIPGSFAGSWLVDTRLGRKGTLALSFLLGGIFQLGFIWFQNLDLVTYCGAAVAFFATLMCAVLFSYTPEVFDPRLRSTACGIAASLSRLLAIISPMLAGVLYSIRVWSPLELSTLLLFISTIITVLLPIETKGINKF